MTREINAAGLDLIKSFEGVMDGDPTTVNLDPYMDPVGIWTIGWGHAIFIGDKPLKGEGNRAKAMGLYLGGITHAQAARLLEADVLDTCRDVEATIAPVSCTDNQFAALVSFAFNLGATALGRSTLLKHLRAGRYDKAPEEFVKWNKAGGRVLNGLTRRRQAERDLFLA